jgi:K(+)-stimulated pyrophosphate-energized sodium pump
MNNSLFYAVPAMGVLGLLYTLWKFNWVAKQDAGDSPHERDQHLYC